VFFFEIWNKIRRLGGERSRTEEREKELLLGDVLLERFGISLNMYCFFLLAWNSFVVGLVSITTLLKNRDGSQIGKRDKVFQTPPAKSV